VPPFWWSGGSAGGEPVAGAVRRGRDSRRRQWLWFSEEDEEGQSGPVGCPGPNNAGWQLGQMPTGNWANTKRI
jgi:hypothetical protein